MPRRAADAIRSTGRERLTTGRRLPLALGVLLLAAPGPAPAGEDGPILAARQAPRLSPAERPGFQLLPDRDVEMRMVLVHAGSQVPESPFLTALLASLRPEVKLLVVAEELADAARTWERLQASGGEGLRQRVRFLIINQKQGEHLELFPWAQDPAWVVYHPDRDQYALITTHPTFSYPGFEGKAFNHFVGERIVHSANPWLDLVDGDFNPLGLFVQGGDLTIGPRYLVAGSFTVAASLRDGEGRPRMVEGRRPTREDVQAELELLSGKEAILLPEAGEVHHDRFLAPLGLDADGKPVYALADPVAALDRLRALTPDARRAAEERIRNLAPGTDAADPRLLAGLLRVTPEVLTAARTSPVVRHLTTIEQLLRHRGIRVERVPALPKRLRSGDGETVFQSPFGLYYTNMLQDSVATPNGIFRSVHFPSYGLPALEERVEEIYRRYFDEIHPLPAVVEGVSGAGPRCMVKVFGVPLPAPTPPAAPAPPPPGR